MVHTGTLRRLSLLIGLIVLVVVALACAKSEPKAAAPAPSAPAAPAAAPAPAKPAAPAATPAPSRPLSAEEAILQYPEGKPLVPGGPAFYPRQLMQQKGYQLHIKYHLRTLPLWEKAKYGGTFIGASIVPPTWTRSFNVLDILSLSRVVFSGMLLNIDLGRCSLVGREGQFDRCKGEYGKNYEIAIIPGVFKTWEQPNPTTYVFHVRPGVVWPKHALMQRQDREVTAQDIAWYLNVVKTEGVLSDNFNLVDKIEAVDRSTVRIAMQSPHVEFLRHMANTSMGIIPKECYDDKGCRKGSTSISPGPFLFNEAESQLRVKLTLDRNPEFYLKGLPYIDRQLSLPVQDPAAQKAAFYTAQVDELRVFSDVELQQTLKRVPSAWTHSQWVIAGNTVLRPQLRGPMGDVRVRRALAMTMDHLTIFEAAYGGHTFFPGLVSRDTFGAEWHYTMAQAGEWYQFNPERAKKLLAEAGYPGGFKTSLVTGLLSGGWWDQLIALQANWKKHLNVDLEIKSLDAVSLNTLQYESKWQDLIFQLGWNITYWADQEGALIHMTKGQRLNLSKIDDPWISEQYLKQRGEFDPAKRAALLWEFEEYERQQVYFFRVSGVAAFTVIHPWEHNGAGHEVTWFNPLNGASWIAMFDVSKVPQR